MARPLKWDRVEDDRGAARRRLSFGARLAWPASSTAGELPTELAARMADATAQMKAQGRGPKLSIWSGLGVIFAGATLIIVAAVYVPAMVAVVVPVCVLGAVALWVVLPPTDRLRHEQSIIDTLLAEGYCASCGYALAGLPVEADGCTVCPECQAAWRLGDIEARPLRDAATAPFNPTPEDAGWHWLDFVLPGRRVNLSYRDRAGRIVPLIDPSLVRPPAAWKSLEPAVRSRVRRALWLRHLPLRIFGVVVFTWVFMGPVFSGRIPWASLLGPLAAPVWLLLWYAVATSLILPSRWNRDAIVSAFRVNGVCASCAAPLPRADPVCGRCGAHW